MAGAPVVFVAHHHMVAAACVRFDSHIIAILATSRRGGVSSSAKRTVNAEHARIFSLATWERSDKSCSSRRIGRNCRPATTLGLSRRDSDFGTIVEAHDTFRAMLGKIVVGESRKGLDATGVNTIRIL